MRSLEPFLWLLGKEWRELLVSRAWWLLVVLMGPLTGVSFLSAIRLYAEVSAAGGGEALAPLSGVWAPTFSACELAAVFLLPFVAIRVAGADRLSGALKLELQRRQSPFTRILAKAVIALVAWLIAMLPSGVAILLWMSYGGHLNAPELGALIAGHVLNAGLTIAVAFAAASMAAHPATAAILTLGVTVGSWIVTFFAAIQGGLWERAAAFTPSAIVADFQRGLLRLDSLLIASVLIAAGLATAAIWQRIGVRPARRVIETTVVLTITAAAIFASAHTRPTWDVTENRANSLPKADEQALRSLRDPLRIVVHLAPEDPRRADLERQAFSKLRRLVADLDIEYFSSSASGLFEQNNAGYGELAYQYRGRTETSRVTTAEGVLEAIYAVAAVEPRKDAEEPVFRGYPLTTPPRGAATVFYGLWPGLTLLCGYLVRRRFQ